MARTWPIRFLIIFLFVGIGTVLAHLFLTAPDPIDCSHLRSVQKAACDQYLPLAAAVELNRETLAGIEISAIGTIALVITIIFSSRATAAAERSTAHAREASARELRPYLAVDTIKNMWRGDEEDPPGVKTRYVEITWKNVGRTPAQHVRSKCSYGIFDGEIPKDFQYPDQNAGQGAVGVVGPEKSFNSHTFDIPVEEVVRAIKNEIRIHLWAWVEYEGFEPNIRYRTEYHCFLEYGDINDKPRPGSNLNYVLLQEFNSMDGACFHAAQPPISVQLSSAK